MFDQRIRLYSDDGSTRGRVLESSRLTVTLADSGASQLTFSVSQSVAGSLPSSFVVGVEWLTGAGKWAAMPRSDRFICTVIDGDDADLTGTVNVTGQEYVTWLMGRMFVQATSTSGLQQRLWADATPGLILNNIVAEAKGAGWGPSVTVDFSATVDSAGVAWVQDDCTSIPWRVASTTCVQVLQQLSEQGRIEWWTEGMTLRVFRPGTGVDRSDAVVLGGAGFSKQPRKTSFDGVFTDLTVMFEDGFVNLVNPQADGRFGHLWSVMTQSGVTDAAAATSAAQAALTRGQATAQELSYEWTPTAALPDPWAVRIGDVVTCRTIDGKRKLRVIGFVVEKTDQVVVRAVVGDKLLSLIAKVANRSSQATVGQIISGSGDALPAGPAPSVAAPAAPTGLHVVSSSSVWLDDGSGMATVSLAWNVVAQNTDFAPVDVRGYEVASRVESGTATVDATVDAPSADVTGWACAVTRLVKVRAVSRAGLVGAWSEEVSVTPPMPAQLTPKVPTGLTVTSNVAVFLPSGAAQCTVGLSWDPVTQSLDGVPVVVDAYELWVSDSLTMPGSSVGQVSATVGVVAVPVGVPRWVSVRARTTLGDWSDLTAPVKLTGAAPSSPTSAPSKPTLLSSLGNVTVSWDGLPAAAAGFRRVIAQTSTDGTVWVEAGTYASVAGAVAVVRATVGQTVQARLVAEDTLGRRSAASTVASIVVAGVTGPDLVAGSVTTNALAAGAVTTEKIDAGVGGQLNLTGNGSITLLAGQAQTQAGQISQAQDAATQAQQSANQAGTQAGQAASAAGSAQQAADAAAQAAANAQAGVNTFATAVVIDATGVDVSAPGSSTSAHIAPGRISMRIDGVDVAWMEAGRMVAPIFEGDQVRLGNHQIEKYGTNGTVVRSLG